MFERWEYEECMKKNLDYQDLKEAIGKRMLEKDYINIILNLKKVLHYEVGTPLTNQFYLGAYSGEGYGLNSSVYRFSEGHELNRNKYKRFISNRTRYAHLVLLVL